MKMVDIGYVRSGFGLTIVPRFPFSTLTLHLHESNLNAPPCLEPLKEQTHCNPATRLLINPLGPRLAIYFHQCLNLLLSLATRLFLIKKLFSPGIICVPPPRPVLSPKVLRHRFSLGVKRPNWSLLPSI